MVNPNQLTRDQLVEQDWTDPRILEHVYLERGWAATDIAAAFGVDRQLVIQELKEVGIWTEMAGRTPSKGLARKLWEHGLHTPDAGGGEA